MTKKSIDEKISSALDITPADEEKSIELKKPTEITTTKETDLNVDYKQVRRNLKDLISTGNGAIDGILNVASEGEHPRAYEVAAQLIKVVGDTNKELIDLHKKVKDIQKDDVKLTQNNTTNNAIYVGSTNELQSLINQGRSSAKRIDTVEEDIIDHE